MSNEGPAKYHLSLNIENAKHRQVSDQRYYAGGYKKAYIACKNKSRLYESLKWQYDHSNLGIRREFDEIILLKNSMT